LRRAETRDEASTNVGNELLSAFKIASFTFDEEKDIADKSPMAQNEQKNKEWVKKQIIIFNSLKVNCYLIILGGNNT